MRIRREKVDDSKVDPPLPCQPIMNPWSGPSPISALIAFARVSSSSGRNPMTLSCTSTIFNVDGDGDDVHANWVASQYDRARGEMVSYLNWGPPANDHLIESCLRTGQLGILVPVVPAHFHIPLSSSPPSCSMQRHLKYSKMGRQWSFGRSSSSSSNRLSLMMMQVGEKCIMLLPEPHNYEQ